MSDRYVIANRGDGLGERLCAIYNGLLVSELTGVPFKFYWPINHNQKDKFHSLPEVNEIFSDAFVEAHHDGLAEKASPSFQLVRKDTVEDFSQLLSGQLQDKSLMVSQSNYLGYILKDTEVVQSLKKRISEKMDFCDSLKLVINQANQVDLPDNLTAIHLRSGDIVYGRFSVSTQFYHKVICTPMAKLILENKASDESILLVGQEPDFAKKVAQLGLAFDANSLSEKFDFNAVERAFFDFTLVSRCQYKIDGSSGFTRLAEFLGDVKTKKIFSIKSKSEWAVEIYNDLSKDKHLHTAEQVGFAASLCYDFTYDSEDVEESIKYLKLATEYNPQNKLFWLLLIINYYRKKDYSTAHVVEKQMFVALDCDAVSLETDKSFLRMLETKLVGKKDESIFGKYSAFIHDAKVSGVRFANFIERVAFN